MFKLIATLIIASVFTTIAAESHHCVELTLRNRTGVDILSVSEDLSGAGILYCSGGHVAHAAAYKDTHLCVEDVQDAGLKDILINNGFAKLRRGIMQNDEITCTESGFPLKMHCHH